MFWGQVTDDLTLERVKNQGKGGWGEERENKPRATGETGPFDSRSPRCRIRNNKREAGGVGLGTSRGLLDCLGLVAADPTRRLWFPKRVAVCVCAADVRACVIDCGEGGGQHKMPHKLQDGIWGREGSVQAACALGLQLSCCACPDADAGLQMGDCEPVGDRMASRGPRQDSYVDPRGMSELRVTRPRLTLTWKLDVCDCCDAGVGRGLLRVVIVIIAVPLLLSWSAETSRSLDRRAGGRKDR